MDYVSAERKQGKVEAEYCDKSYRFFVFVSTKLRSANEEYSTDKKHTYKNYRQTYTTKQSENNGVY